MQTSQDFTKTFVLGRSPHEVFEAIRDVRAWWAGDIQGSTADVGDRFTYRYEALHRSTQTVEELVPDARIAWRVSDAHLAFTKATTEWNGTRVVFELRPDRGGTELRFTHEGLLPSCECYAGCSDGWSFHLKTLVRQLGGTP